MKNFLESLRTHLPLIIAAAALIASFCSLQVNQSNLLKDMAEVKQETKQQGLVLAEVKTKVDLLLEKKLSFTELIPLID